MPGRCNDPFGSEDLVVVSDGSVQTVPGLAWRSQECPVSLGRLDKTLDRRGVQTHGKVGDADAALTPAIEVWRARRDHLKRVCPSCPIKPRRRTP